MPIRTIAICRQHDTSFLTRSLTPILSNNSSHAPALLRALTGTIAWSKGDGRGAGEGTPGRGLGVLMAPTEARPDTSTRGGTTSGSSGRVSATGACCRCAGAGAGVG